MLSINNQLQTAEIPLDNIGKCKIEILNNCGAIIQTILLDDHNLQINYSRYQSGNYYIKLETEHETVLKSITI